MDQAQPHHKAALMSALALFDLLEKHLPSGADRAQIACEAYDRFMTTLKLYDHYRGAAPHGGPTALQLPAAAPYPQGGDPASVLRDLPEAGVVANPKAAH